MDTDPSTCSSTRQMLGAGPLGMASNHQEHADQRSCSTFHEPICSPCSLDSVGLGALQLLPLFTYDPPFASIFMFFACKCQTFILPSNQRGEGGVGLGEWWLRVWMPGSDFRWKVGMMGNCTCRNNSFKHLPSSGSLSHTLSVTATFHVGNAL